MPQRTSLVLRRSWVRFVSALLLAPSAVCVAQNADQGDSASKTASRACSANPVLTSTAKKKNARKVRNPPAPEPPPTCLEIKGQAIEVQEFLQNRAREAGWRIGENRASEDSWSYVRYLDSEELSRFADTKVLIEPVDFTNGKAAVVVRTIELPDGYVRVQISTRFEGEGRSTDKYSAQPGNIWPLTSKGVLEQELIKALQSGYKPMG